MDLNPGTNALDKTYSKTVEATGDFSTYKYKPVLKAFSSSGAVAGDYTGSVLVDFTLTFEVPQDIEDGDGVTISSELVQSKRFEFDRFTGGEIEVELAKLMFATTPVGLEFKAGVLDFRIRGDGFFEDNSILTLQHGAAASAALASDTDSAESGDDIKVTVTVTDQYNNLCTTYSNSNAGKLASTSTTAKFTKNVQVENGEAEVAVSNPKAESINMTLTYSGLTVAGSPIAIYWTAGQTFSFSFGDFADLDTVKIGNKNTPYAAANTDVEVVISALDISGNIDTGENRRIGITFTCDFDGTECDPAVQKITSAVTSVSGISDNVVQFQSGVATFTMLSTEPQEQLEIGFVAVQAFRTPVPSYNDRHTIRFVENCDGLATYQNVPGTVECKNVSAVCAPGSFQVYGSNKTFDRKCDSCDGINNFQDQEDQPACHPMGPTCTIGTYTSIAASPTTNRSCTGCDGIFTYQDLAGQAECKNTTACVPGEFVVADSTAETDRECSKCPKGTADTDKDPTSVCDKCSPLLVATASFDNDNLVIQFQDNGTSVYVSLTTGTTLSKWSIGAGHCTYDDDGQLDPPESLLEGGDMTGKHGVLSSSGGVHDTEISLWGDDSLSQRGVYIQEGSFSGCANIVWTEAPTFSDALGNVNCTTVTECDPGQEESLSFLATRDRTCKACNGKTKYQDDGGQRYCKDVMTCDFAPGYRQQIAPNATNDRVCEPVTCPGLAAPEFGFVSEPCNGTDEVEAFGTVCHYSCDKDNSFLMAGLEGDQAMSRTCMQEGNFNYEAPTCVCTPGLFLDPLAKVCVSVCGTGTYNSESGDGEKKCDICDDACADGEYESVACTPYTNRVCTKCSSCEDGTFNSGGCFAHNTTDTICSEHTPCAAGSYETKEGTTTEDRQCDTCEDCPTTSFASTGCCGTVQTYCDSLSSCIPGVEYEAFPPLDAPQGGYASDRHCRPYTKCGTGEFYNSFGNGTDDRDCKPCTTCPYGETATDDCVQGNLASKFLGTDTVCTPWSACGADQFYIQKPTAYSDGVCGDCTACQEGEYAAGGCDGVEDTDCQLKTVCDTETQFETYAGDVANDRACDNCTVCSNTTRLVAACSSHADADCSTDLAFDEMTEPLVCARGEVYIGSPPNHACIECDECATGTFAEGGESCRGANTFNNPDCSPWSVCAPGTFQAATPSSTTDRICKTCTPCPYGHLFVSGCNITHDSVCEPEPTCEEILGVPGYEVVAGTAEKAHVCTACRTCDYDAGDATTLWTRTGEYASGGCSGQEDTVCSTFTECSQNEFIVKRGTATSDNVCQECSTKSLGRRGGSKDPFTCPDLAADRCPVDWMTTTSAATTVADYHYITGSVTFGGDYDAVVVDTLQRKPVFEDAATLAIQEYMTSLTISNISVENLQVSKGSIVAMFDATSGTDEAINVLQQQLADLSVGWTGLDFVYEGYDLAVVSSNLVLETSTTMSTVTPKPTTKPITTTKATTTVAAAVVTATDPAPVATDGPAGNVSAGESRIEYVEATGFGTGGIVGVIFGALAIILFVAFLVIRKRDQDNAIGGMSPLQRKASTSSIEMPTEDGYLGVSGEAEDAGLFGNDVAEENRRLRSEVDGIRTKIAEKDALANLQSSSQKSAEAAMDNAIAQRIKVENSAIAKEVATLQAEIKKKQKATKFQQEAAKQVNLVAQKRQLEEEIRRANEIEQVALQAIADFDIAGAEDI